MTIDTSNTQYETLYNLEAGDTFIHEGKIYLVIKGSVYHCVSKNTETIYEDAMREVACVDLVFNEIKVFDKYTRVYPKQYKLVGREII